jgi:hypothetical protein
LTTLLLVACVGMIAGAFLILRISPMDFTQGIFQRLTSAPKKHSLATSTRAHTAKRSPSCGGRSRTRKPSSRPPARKQKFPMICAVSLLLFAIGAAVAIVMSNFFLVPVMAVGMMFIPFWYVKLTAGHFKKDVSSELETALSIITTAYLRSEDFLTAVEENISYLNQPVLRRVPELSHAGAKHIDPDMDAALASCETPSTTRSSGSGATRSWPVSMTAGLKTTLTPIVSVSCRICGS